MRLRARGRAPVVAVLLGIAVVAAAQPPRVPELRTAPVTLLDGAPYVRAGDLARLLDAATFWRAETRKLELRAGTHRIRMTVDHPFVIVDQRTVRLDHPVRSRGGELQVPVGLVESLPRDSLLARLVPDLERRRVIRVPPEGLVRTPTVAFGDSLVRITIPTDRPAEAAVTSRAREHFRVRLPGVFAGRLSDSLATGLLAAARLVSGGPITVFEFAADSGLRGFRLEPDPARRVVQLEFLARGARLEPFATEAARGRLRVVVLDPGHGGGDRGVSSNGMVEKDLAMALARQLRADLQRRLGVDVVLTRDGDQAVRPQRRAEIANSARADLVLSLHFDGAAGTARRGITAWCPPASPVAPAGGPAARNRPLVVTPWRDVVLGHAVASRTAADKVLGAIEQQGLGPSRLREFLALPMLGVNAPALVIECGVLTSPTDRERLRDPAALARLSSAIVDGVAGWASGR